MSQSTTGNGRGRSEGSRASQFVNGKNPLADNGGKERAVSGGSWQEEGLPAGLRALRFVEEEAEGCERTPRERAARRLYKTHLDAFYRRLDRLEAEWEERKAVKAKEAEAVEEVTDEGVARARALIEKLLNECGEDKCPNCGTSRKDRRDE